MEAIVTASEANDLSTSQQSDTEAAPTYSVVQVPMPHAVQVVGSDGDGNLITVTDDEESRKRREVLARRPSYRKILNDLSAESPQGAITIAKIEEESNSSQTSQDSGDVGETVIHTSMPGIQLQQATGENTYVLPSGAIQIAAHGDGTTHQGLQTLTMTNANAANASAAGATIVQYAQGPDGQFFIPGGLSALSAGNVQYQIAPTMMPQGVVMATAGTTIASPQQLSEEAARKRELRLLKNKDAAKECRRKKKDYVKCLENRVAVLENQNKTLIEELKSLKELYCQKEAQM